MAKCATRDFKELVIILYSIFRGMPGRISNDATKNYIYISSYFKICKELNILTETSCIFWLPWYWVCYTENCGVINNVFSTLCVQATVKLLF